MAGRGSLAGLLSYGDANQIVVEMGREVLPVVKHTPVLAGVCGTDPFRVMDVFLRQLKEQGFAGVQNFPTVGLIDGVFRQNLEETGMGYDLEVEMIQKAHDLDMVTSPYVFNIEEAAKMAIENAPEYRLQDNAIDGYSDAYDALEKVTPNEIRYTGNFKTFVSRQVDPQLALEGTYSNYQSAFLKKENIKRDIKPRWLPHMCGCAGSYMLRAYRTCGCLNA